MTFKTAVNIIHQVSERMEDTLRQYCMSYTIPHHFMILRFGYDYRGALQMRTSFILDVHETAVDCLEP